MDKEIYSLEKLFSSSLNFESDEIKNDELYNLTISEIITILKNIDIMKKIIPSYTFIKIDCSLMDSEKEKILQKYEINGFPAILIINPKNNNNIEILILLN